VAGTSECRPTRSLVGVALRGGRASSPALRCSGRVESASTSSAEARPALGCAAPADAQRRRTSGAQRPHRGAIRASTSSEAPRPALGCAAPADAQRRRTRSLKRRPSARMVMDSDDEDDGNWVECDSAEQAARYGLGCFSDSYAGPEFDRDLEWLRAGGDPTRDCHGPGTAVTAGPLLFNQHCVHLAVLEGRPDLVAKLIRAGALADAVTHPRLVSPRAAQEGQKGWTPLHYACHHGRLEIVKLLVSHGADVDRTISPTCGFPLWLATCRDLHSKQPGRSKECRRVFRVLIRAGATIPMPWNDLKGLWHLTHHFPTDERWIAKIVAAGGFAAYEIAHREQLLTTASEWLGHRLPDDVISRVVVYWAHVGEW